MVEEEEAIPFVFDPLSRVPSPVARSKVDRETADLRRHLAVRMARIDVLSGDTGSPP
jgi:hypothetical protein